MLNVLFIQHHWHEQHEEVLLLFLLSWYDNTGTTWVSQFKHHFLSSHAVEDIHEERTLETDAHGSAAASAREMTSKPRETLPPEGVNLRALESRFITTFCTLSASTHIS